MEEGSGGGVGGAASSSSSTLLCGGGRQRFEVELRPGETTIVSWKKLTKDANKAAKNNNDNKAPPVSAPPVPLPVAAAIPALDSRIAPPTGDAPENEANDAPGGSRFSAVIEKIERLYMGKNSSDEEDLNDVPDDDEYDTEDSFIDDTELDEYFQVDNSAIKHDGFFVNRGKLERTNEPTALPTEQPKKRRRKDSAKGDSGSNDGNVPNKQIKVNKKESRKVVAPIDKNAPTPSRTIALPPVNSDDLKYQSPIIALGTVVKKPIDSNTDPSPIKILDVEAKLKQKAGVLQSKKQATKLKGGSISPVVSSQKVNEKSGDVKLKCHGQLVNNLEEVHQSVLPKEKSVTYQQVDMKASEIPSQPQKNPNIVRKEGSTSSTKPKSTILMLDKAIRDLEKIVAETRPPSMEVPEADNSAQAVKRRMPPEIKQKLAKVARLAHAIHGKLTKELLHRLMSIVGHLIQIRSLKRNLHNMVSMGLSAKEEKDARLQQLKKEVDDMVKTRAPMMKPEAVEQQAGSSDDFQEPSSKEKIVKSKFVTDDALEDKICEVYDLYVEGLDEDAAPQVRKLYQELAELWPKGCMDNHGIKRAICRAKDRRKALYRRKDQENMKRKKLLVSKTEINSSDPTSAVLVQHPPDKPATDSTPPVRSITTTLTATAATRPPNSSNIPATDRPKHEKLKGTSNNLTEPTPTELVKKKAKKKPETDSEHSGHVDDKRKPYKQMTSTLVKPATPESVIPVPESVIPVTEQPTVNRAADLP